VQSVSVKPLVLFLFAFIPSAILVCGVAVLFLPVTGRGLSKSRVELPAAMLTDSSRVSIHRKTVLSHRYGQPETAPPEMTGTINLAETLSGRVQTVNADAGPPKLERDQLVPRNTPKADPGTPAVTNVANASHSFPAFQSPSTPHLRSVALDPNLTPRASAAKIPVKSPSADSYGERVWAALARHKPKAVLRGSTTVMFEIGASGALGYARVDQSSGNARLDKMALQTVHDSAPFPPPPEKSSYKIRIDFQ
jgi:TonB family protein